MFPFIWLYPLQTQRERYLVLSTRLKRGVIYLATSTALTSGVPLWRLEYQSDSKVRVRCRHPRGAPCAMWYVICAKAKDAISLTRIINLNRQHEHPTPYTRISEQLTINLNWRVVCVCSYHDKIIFQLLGWHACVTPQHPHRTTAPNNKSYMNTIQENSSEKYKHHRDWKQAKPLS